MNPLIPSSSPAPALREDTEPYQSAKGCLQLTALILLCGVVCVTAGIGISWYIHASVG